MQRLVLIDGHAILHRAYHALPPLTNRSGELVNAVYGFCTILLKVIDDLKPQYLAVAFDTPKPTFRQKEFIGYQAQRPKMDQELSGQIEKVQRVVKAFGIPIFEVPGFEADDAIGTLARQATEDTKILRYQDIKKKKLKKSPNIAISQYPNIEIIIVSGDKDLFQLVNKKVKLYMPIHGLSETQIFGEKEVEEKMGVGPSKIVDYKALVGDPSDNYPGVPGIGPKGAIDLIKKFGTVDKIYQSLGKIDNENLRKKLEEGQKSAKLSKMLATVVTDAPVKLDLEKAKLKDFNNEKSLDILRELGFKSLVARLSGGEVKKVLKRSKKENEKELQPSLF